LNPRSFGIFTRGVVVLAAIGFCVSLVWALPPDLTAEQKAAIKKCTDKYYDDINRCLREHPQLEYNDCKRAADAGFKVCMDKNGVSARVPTPKPPVDRGSGKPKTSDGLSIPRPLRHHIDGSTLPATEITTTNKSSPSPAPKPKPSRSPSSRR
jgi:hypothetical protein